MIYQCKNEMEVEICTPMSGYYQILKMIEQLSDESENLPFTSEDFGIKSEQLKAYIERLNDSENSTFLVARLNQQPIGFGYLEGGKRQRTHHCANLGIGVLKEYSNLGIGKAIMSELIRYATESESIAKIELQVRKDNANAIKLYKDTGFEVEGISRRSLFVNGEFYDYINMGKIID